jgi:hypothetical protein
MGAAASDQPSFAMRYMGFTTLGGGILLAAYASRERSREVRLGIMAGLALGLLVLWYFLPDLGLLSNNLGPEMMTGIRTQMPNWQDGDVLLMRSVVPEADFLKTTIPVANRPAVERVGYATVATLYPDSRRRPVVLLSYSQYRSDTLWTPTGQVCQPDLEKYYDDELANRVFGYKRYWIAGLTPRTRGTNSEFNSRLFLACTLMWMADQRGGWDLNITRNRGKSGEPEHYVSVPAHVLATQKVDGLTANFEATDFGLGVHLVHLKEPSGVRIFTLGVLSAAVSPNAYIMVPVEITSPSLSSLPKMKDDSDGMK